MISADTNVVVRIVVQDDPMQCRLAEEAWRTAVAGDVQLLAASA